MKSPNLHSHVTAVRLLSFLVFTTILTQVSRSQSVGNWTFTNNTTGAPGAFNTVSVADFSVAIPSRVFQGGTIYFGENGWPAGAVDPAAYMQFTLTPVAGHALNLASVTLILRRSNTGSSGASGPSAWTIRSSLDGYSTDLAGGALTGNFVTSLVPLGVAFNAVASAITFRIYGYNTTISSGGLSRFVFDNIQVTGSDIVLATPLKTFRAVASTGVIDLSFSTNQHRPGASYVLQRSNDARNFITIHRFLNPSNTDDFKGLYSDRNWTYGIEKLYYRLQITDPDESVRYSETIFIRPPEQNVRGLQLQQAGRFVIVRSVQNGPYVFRLTLPSGVEVSSKILNGSDKQWAIRIPDRLSGLCFASVSGAKERISLPLLIR